MIRFSPADCALEGFRLTRERPLAVGLWAALLLTTNLGAMALTLALGLGPTLSAVRPFDPTSLPAQALPQVEAAAAWLPALAAALFAINVVLYTAVLRAVIEPSDARFAYLRLGRHEARQALLWLYALVVLAAYGFGLMLVLGVATALQNDLEPPIGKFVLAAVAAGVFLALLYPLVRLSIAPAATFAEHRLVLFSAWPDTRDQFWSLLGGYGVAALLASAVLVLSSVVVGPLTAAAALATGQGAGLLERMTHPDMSSLAAFFRPETIASLALDSVVMAMSLVILAAPAPAIYLALKGRERR